ncbi:MAG TPA: hypothetical protein VJ783_02275 [Pirellulales bacterium]|nr:hypothetical protein [Pirellulales bacterium]
MPNLAICCPHCGSVECGEYRANAFVCQHCDATFRWTNPGEVTLLHKPAHCDCGKNPMGACTRCEKPLCRLHYVTWQAILTVWRDFLLLSKAQRCGWFSQSWVADAANEVARGRDSPFLPVMPSDIAKWNLSAIGVARGREGDLLCFDCAEAALPDVLQLVRARNATLRNRGRLCPFCELEGTHERNAFQTGYVLAGHRCQECGQLVCLKHRIACTKCGKSFCKPHAPALSDQLCRACRPWLVTQAVCAFWHSL